MSASYMVEDVEPVETTLVEMSGSFMSLVDKYRPCSDEDCVALIQPPPEWNPSSNIREKFHCSVKVTEQTLKPIGNQRSGLYHVLLKQKNPDTIAELETQASSRRLPGQSSDLSAVPYSKMMEDLVFSNLGVEATKYAIDQTNTSCFENSLGVNLGFLKSGLEYAYVKRSEGLKVLGVLTVMIYISVFSSFFGIHYEDYLLGSASFLHYGASKIWYVIAPKHLHTLERIVKEKLSQKGSSYSRCKRFLSHKDVFLTPQFLRDHGIPFKRVVQERGMLLILYPGCLHFGYNQGFNIAESINWYDAGMRKALDYVLYFKPDNCIGMFMNFFPVFMMKHTEALVRSIYTGNYKSRNPYEEAEKTEKVEPMGNLHSYYKDVRVAYRHVDAEDRLSDARLMVLGNNNTRRELDKQKSNLSALEDSLIQLQRKLLQFDISCGEVLCPCSLHCLDLSIT